MKSKRVLHQMRKRIENNPPFHLFRVVSLLFIFGVILYACAAEAPDVIHTKEPPTPVPGQTPEPIEYWMVDLEWPSSIFLGESDVIRLTLIPSESEITIELEFADHEKITNQISIVRPQGYTLTAVAELNARNFDISPDNPQTRELVTGKPETWHWNIAPNHAGVQRISINVILEWLDLYSELPTRRKFGGFSQAVEIKVQSILGMAKSEAFQVLLLFMGLGVIIGFYARTKTRTKHLPVVISQTPDSNVILEPQSNIELPQDFRNVFQAIFRSYARVVIEKEFTSGYSGARTFMVIPIKSNQKADAHTIIKINEIGSIEREYHNYLNYVKNTLPPITARIQQEPISVQNTSLAGLRYTFLGAPGSMPTSLHQTLIQGPNPIWLERIFESFGPNWWLQQNPYTFRLGQEYDRKLPAHYVVEPARGKGKELNGAMPIPIYSFSIGDLVNLSNFKIRDKHLEGNQISLIGKETPGEASLRVTWLSNSLPKMALGRIVATRDSVLESATAGFDLFGLPNPLDRYPQILSETIQGTKSTIHGDLNLQNIMAGPGEVVWLIDFAETREGHTLFDFSHLTVEIISHIISNQIKSPNDFLKRLNAKELPLVNVMTEIAHQCLFNKSQPREYKLALFISCLGALKYKNLDTNSKHLLFLTAAHLINKL